MFVLWVIHYKCGLNKKCLFRHVSVKQRVIIPPLSLFQWTNGTTSSWSERKPVRPDNCLLPSNFFAYINILLHILAFLYTQSLSCPHMWNSFLVSVRGLYSITTTTASWNRMGKMKIVVLFSPGTDSWRTLAILLLGIPVIFWKDIFLSTSRPGSHGSQNLVQWKADRRFTLSEAIWCQKLFCIKSPCSPTVNIYVVHEAIESKRFKCP